MTVGKSFLDFMGGGAWPFLVGEVTCLVDSVNGRDLCIVVSFVQQSVRFLQGLYTVSIRKSKSITGL